MSDLIIEVCKINKVRNHNNADRLDVATVKDWECIVGRDQYKVGDLVIFIPPDSILTETLIEKYELTYLKRNGRTGTVKLRGEISQGLCFPASDFNKTKAGEDVAKELGITKYEPPEAPFYKNGNQTSRRKSNPHFNKYTDIQNIKNYTKIFHKGDNIVITEKIHGTNFRCGYMPIHIDPQNWFYRILNKIKSKVFGITHEFVYGSHNVQLSSNTKKNFYGEDVYGKIAKKYDLAKKLKSFVDSDTNVNSITLYGEIYGNEIQDLTYGIEDIDLVIFDMKVNGEFLDYDDMVFNVDTLFDLPTVPLLYKGKYEDKRIIKKYTEGNTMMLVNSPQLREGCVIKSMTEERTPIGRNARSRKILKSVSTEYLSRKAASEFH